MPITTVDAPITEPVTLQDMRAQLRLDDDITDEDDLIDAYISAAREYCEEQTGRHFAPKTLRWAGCFNTPDIELAANLADVHYVQYIDPENVTRSLPEASYYVDSISIVGRIIPLSHWPATHPTHPYPVEIEFDVGEAECPHSVKQAIKLLVSHWYENRESSTNEFVGGQLGETIAALLSAQRVLHL